MKHFQSKVLTAAILATLSGSAIAADVYEKPEVDKKITAVEEKITAAKADLDQKLEAQKTSNSEEIKKVKDVVKNLIEGDDQNPGLIDTIGDLNTSVENNKSEIDELKKGLETTDKALDETTKALNQAEEKITAFATETKTSIGEIDKKLEDVSNTVSEHTDKLNEITDSLNETDTKVKAAKDAAGKAEAAAGKADTAAGKAEAAAAKVTDVEKVAKAALVEAYNNAQDINGFKAGDTIYDIDENNEITAKKATEDDVKADDFGGLGLKEVVAEHDQSLADLTETVNENSEALVKTAEVVNQHTADLTAVKTAINKNEDAINDTKDDLALVTATAINNVQDINGFKAGDTIYDIDENGKITKKEATAADVEADDFKGLGLKEVVAEHDQSLADLTETVNENSEALVKTAEVVNQHTADLKAVETAINENKAAIDKNKDDIKAIAEGVRDNVLPALEANREDIDANKKAIDENKANADKRFTAVHDAVKAVADQVADNGNNIDANKKAIDENKAAIAKKADQTALDAVSGKVDENKAAIAKKADQTALDAVSGKVNKNTADIATKANSADVYTKKESDSKFVKVENSINGLDTTTKGLNTRLVSAEKSVADHGTRLAAAEKSVADHGTRLASAEKSITEHGTRLNGLDKTVSDLRKETRQGLAEQAALSGLFQPYNVGRFNVTAAVGGYKSESAVAIGTGFRFTENFAAKAGVAVGTSSGSSAAYHVGVNYEW